MKTIASTIAAALLGACLIAAPAHADEPTEAAPCVTRNDGTDAEMSLRNEVSELRVNLAVVEQHADFLDAQRTLDSKTIQQLERKVDRKQQVIVRLRAELAAAR